MKENKQDFGFTLIELLVTLGIVGILASMAVATFDTYRTYAKIAEFEITYVNLRTALEARETPGSSVYRSARRWFGDSTTLVGITSIDELVPGITFDKTYFLYEVEVNTGCISVGCITLSVVLGDCRRDHTGYKLRRVYNDASSLTVPWVDVAFYAVACPEEYS